DGFVQVMTAALAGGGLDIDACRGEHPLPGPLAARVRVLEGEGGGKLDPAGPSFEIASVLGADPVEMPGKLRLQERGELGDEVVVILTRPHDDLVRADVHVLDSQAAALEEAKPGSVHQ